MDRWRGGLRGVGGVSGAAGESNRMNVGLLRREGTAAGEAPPKRHNVLGVMALAVIVLVLILAAGLALGIFAARLLWGLRTR